jgi:hypothetical protein
MKRTTADRDGDVHRQDRRSAGADRSSGGERSSPVASVHAAAGNQAVQRQASETDQQSGDREDKQLEADVSEQASIHAVTRALRNRGFTPAPGFTLEDYVRTDVSQATRGETVTGTREVFVRVGPDGHLLPRHDAIEQRGDVEPGSLQGATRLLNLELFQYPDGQHDVAMKLLDVESGAIKNQRMGEGGVLNTGLSDAIGAAWEKFEVDLGDPTDGRVPDQPESPGGGGGPSPEGGSGGPGGGSDGPKGGSGGPESASGDGQSGSAAGQQSAAGGAGAGAASATTATDGGDYEVEEGDTLWDIAEQEYGDGRKWGVIFEANKQTPENPDGIEDPDLIHPKQMLALPSQREAEQFDRSEYDPPESYGRGEGTF